MIDIKEKNLPLVREVGRAPKSDLIWDLILLLLIIATLGGLSLIANFFKAQI